MGKELISAPLEADNYRAALVAFQKTWSGDHDELLAFVEMHAPLHVQGQDLHVLSIGAGDGKRDAAALKVLYKVSKPENIFYTALEPNGAQLAVLSEYFASKVEHAECVTLQQNAQDYVFPEATFDVIFYTHSLYHMRGVEHELLEKSVQALKPDGCIIVALATEQGGIPKMKAAFAHIIEYGVQGSFGQESVLKMLEAHFDVAQYQFRALPEVYIDVRSCFEAGSDLGKPLLNFVLQADTSKLPDEVMSNVLEKLAQMAPQFEDGSRRLPHGSGLFLIKS